MTDEHKTPWPKSREEMNRLIDEQLRTMDGKDIEAGYNQGPEVMAAVAEIAFNYASHVVGSSGFQADFASMRLLGWLRSYHGPFGVLDGYNMLYPQYDLIGKAQKWVVEWGDDDWLKEEAQKLLDKAEKDGGPVSGRVVEHWRAIIAGEKPYLHGRTP